MFWIKQQHTHIQIPFCSNFNQYSTIISKVQNLGHGENKHYFFFTTTAVLKKVKRKNCGQHSFRFLYIKMKKGNLSFMLVSQSELFSHPPHCSQKGRNNCCINKTVANVWNFAHEKIIVEMILLRITNT